MDLLKDKRVLVAALCAAWPLLYGFNLPVAHASDTSKTDALGSPEETGVLHVATRPGATIYYLDRLKNPVGPEFNLASLFAHSQGWEIEWTLYHTTEEILAALDRGESHLAAAGLMHSPARDARFTSVPGHTDIKEQVVCHRAMEPMPRQPEELIGVGITVAAYSGHVDTLKTLTESHQGIKFLEDDNQSTEDLLLAVAEQELDCTVVNSNVFQVVRRRYPHLDVAMDLTTDRHLGWYMPAGSDALAGKITAWMNSPPGDEAMQYVQSRYYTYISDFDFVDLRALSRRIKDRLPTYIERFAEAEANTGMPADLLAALSYQESHWDPEAVSPTGVRGIMMLTRDTAASLGVNRLDPVAAIEGGARYLADRHRRLPESIQEPDRTFMALASYNVGLGHILDARRLAEERGLDPDSWDDVRTVLPLKADERYYPSTRYGYARGNEPVQYVQRIRNYQSVISTAFD
ncbi:MAG: membrane-bound lytic murein transglycosylase MltF [Natronospirillum sp.]